MQENPSALVRLGAFALLISLTFAATPPVSRGEAIVGVSQSNSTGQTVMKGIVILTQFPDVKNRVDRSFVQRRFSQGLNNYVREMSYGRVSLDVEVTKRWHTLPDSINKYRISSRNLEVDKPRVRKLIDDALGAVDKRVDLSRFAFTAVFLGAGVQDYGMVGLCGYPGMLGWSSQAALKTQGGQDVKGVAIFCHQAHLGTLFHDVAHVLGGVKDGKRMVPCLYDHDLQAKPGNMRDTFVDATINMGFWDTMSCHFYQRQMPPPGISSWTRIRLGWIDPAKVKVIRPRENVEFSLGPLEEGSSETLVAKLPLSRTTYYLIENRQPIGFDKNLPGSGVLIMYADDSVAECRHGRAPVRLVNADPLVPHLEGAAFDVGKRNSFQDDRNRVRIELKEKSKGSYKLLITRQ